MSISGIAAMDYQTEYETKKTLKNTSEKKFNNYMGRVSDTGISNFTLHCFDNEEGDITIGAKASADGGSVTVYKTKDFDPENPVYKVKIWDVNGNITEKMVDISKVNPKNCDSIDMWAYASHLSDSGQYEDAQTRFMMASAYQNTYNNYSEKSIFNKTNWLDVVKDAMQMQYNSGNLSGYLEYKKFLGFLEA